MTNDNRFVAGDRQYVDGNPSLVLGRLQHGEAVSGVTWARTRVSGSPTPSTRDLGKNYHPK